MKKRFISKKVRKKRKTLFIFILLFLIGIILGFKYLNKSTIKISDREYAEILLINSYSRKKEVLNNKYLSLFRSYLTKPINYLENNYIDIKTLPVIEKEKEMILLPLVIPLSRKVIQTKRHLFKKIHIFRKKIKNSLYLLSRRSFFA